MTRLTSVLRSFVRLSLAAVFTASALAATASAQDIVVDSATSYQSIDGFGGASAWQGIIPGTLADRIWRNGPGQLGFTLERAGIWNQDDATMQKRRNDEIANIASAHLRGARALGTEWKYPQMLLTAPAGAGGCWTMDPARYADYAAFLRRSADDMRLDYVSITNEPNDGCPHFRWTGEQIRDFVSNYGALVNRPVIIAENSAFDDRDTDPSLNAPAAARNVAVVGGHFYGSGNRPHLNAMAHGKPVWMTEHAIKGTDIHSAIAVASEVSKAMTNGFSAYLWWWMTAPGSANPIDRLFDNAGNLQPNGAALAQFSKFVRPHFVRVAASDDPGRMLMITAYKGNGLVIIAVNTGNANQQATFRIKHGGDAGTFFVTRTSARESLASLPPIKESDGRFTASLPAQSITTFYTRQPQ